MFALEPEGRLLFAASDARGGLALWVSDGTETGTRMVGDIAPGARSSNPWIISRSGDAVFVGADDGIHGFELWRLSVRLLDDITPPTVKCPADVTAEAVGSLGAPVTYEGASASDDLTPKPTLAYSHAPGSVFPIGKTRVGVVARDGAGNLLLGWMSARRRRASSSRPRGA
ncbi:HYR domain-containing protein [Archangium violaceum]|uniref:HYR domain-containing protein n=1 Tax=Archangium violaceum TaxID=83451 RepID=UPI001EEFB68A|nr:HYR domain-containing protein [Archangium violaceum]